MGIRNFNDKIDASYLRKSAKLLEDIKETSYEMMNLKSSDKVLDIGCGPGIDVYNISKIIGEEGKVIGIDNDQNMIDEADNSYNAQNIEFIKGDVRKLPFPDEYFNAVRAERLFQVLSQKYNRDEVFKEMMRVTKKEGTIVLVDADWGSASVDHEDHELTNRLLNFFARFCRPNGYAGREFLSLLKRNDIELADMKVKPVVILDFQETTFGDWLSKEALKHKIATLEELESWNEDLSQRTERQEFFSCSNMILVAGKKS